MKSEKGVTLASLGIYIVVILIALITLTTITTYFQSNVGQFNTKNTQDLEFEKFNLYFIEEIKKTNNSINEDESTSTKIVFSTGNKYEFKDNAIFLNENIKIAEKISECSFSFTTNDNDKQIVTVKMKVGDTERTNEYILSNQTDENIDSQDYIYGYKRKEGTGEIVLDNSIETNLRDYKIYGNSVQNGTPNLNNPVEIQSVGEKTNNFIDYTKFTPYGTGTITLLENGLEYTGNWYISVNADLNPGTTYYMNWEYESIDLITPFWRIKYTDDTYSGQLTNGGAITIPSDKEVSKIMIYPEITSTIHTTKFAKIQLNEGKLKEYEPYGKYKIPITVKDEFENQKTTSIFLDEPLRKIGDYADYIDFENKKLVTCVKVIDDTGTLSLEESLQGMQEAIEIRIGLPNIAISEGTNILKVDTEVAPSKTSIVYYSK